MLGWVLNKNKKRRGKSKYLLSVMVDVVKDGEIIPAIPVEEEKPVEIEIK